MIVQTPREGVTENEAARQSERLSNEVQAVRDFAFREARRQFVSRESSDDIAQVTAKKFFRLRLTIRDAPAWVRTVVRRLVRKRRAAKAQREHFEVILGEPSADPVPEFERRQLWRRVLERLSTTDRLLLEMTRAGHPQREIAEAIGVQTNAVGVLLSRAVKRATRARQDL